MTIRTDLIKYLQYIANTEQTATAIEFDDAWHPVGPQVREELMPEYMLVGADGKLTLTEAGMAALPQ